MEEKFFNQGCGFWLYTKQRSGTLPRFSENAGSLVLILVASELDRNTGRGWTPV